MNKESFFKHQAPTSPFPLALEIERAEGVYLYGPKGERYMDFISGVGVSNIGHRHPKVVEAIKAQVDKHLHTMVYGEYIQSAPAKLAQKLANLLPPSLNCVYFTNSGTEAIEGALKLAKRATERTKIFAFRGAYHGSTHGALSVSGNEVKKRAFRPLLPDVHFLQLNQYAELEQIDRHTAAVIVEPIQGDAGIRISEPAYLQALRQRCSEVGALLIFDEIQSGMGRTGKLFAFEHYGVVPDILCSAKALGGGLPLGAFIADKTLMESLIHRPILGHITTFGGNPVACAASLATLEVIEEEGLLPQAEAKGALIESLLQHPKVIEIRRKGLYFAIEFTDADQVQKIVEYCLAKGIICFWFLSCPESFRIAPPLTISEAEIREACRIILEAFNRLD